MKSVQNSLDSSKNSATSAQDAGNKVIKNVAQGIQNTSWMFDKFSSLLDELASAFDEMPIAESIEKKQVENSIENSSPYSQDNEENDSRSDAPVIDASSSAAAMHAQMNLIAAHHAAKRGSKSDQNNQTEKEDTNATEGSGQREVVDEENVAAVVGTGNSAKAVSGSVVQSSGEKSDGQVSADDAVDEQTQQFLAQQSQKDGVVNSEQHDLLEKNLKLQDHLNEGEQNAQKTTTAADTQVAEGDMPHDSSSQEVDVVASKSSTISQHNSDEADIHGLSNKNNLASTGSLQSSQAMAQSAAQQNQAASSSFQSAVKSAQSAVSQTVESVREMIKELSNVSNASAAVKALGQHTASLATQIKAEKAETQASKNPPPLTRSQLLRTLERVENTLKEIVKSKDGKSISLRLDPPSLGSLKIDISFKEGNLHARIVPESSQVALALRERAHELQSILRRVGIDAMQVSVTIASASSSGQEVPHHTGNLFLGDNAHSEGKGNSEGSDSTPKEQHKGFKGGKNEVINQAGGSELDHWVA